MAQVNPPAFVLEQQPAACITMLGFVLSLPLLLLKGLKHMILTWLGYPGIGTLPTLPDAVFGPWLAFRLYRSPTVVSDAASVNAILAHVRPGMKIGIDMEYNPNVSSQPNNRHITSIQIATPIHLVVIDMRNLNTLPAELHRILSSPDIIKLGVGLQNDTTMLWRDFHVALHRFMDIGFMLRVACPEMYPNGAGNVSLQACVLHVFERLIPKTSSTSYDWSLGVPAVVDPRYTELVTYAALDAEAPLALYKPIRLLLLQKTIAMGRPLPEYWYTFGYNNGNYTRSHPNCRGRDQVWSFVLCPWFAGGDFNGYWM
ncbi:ribonuclease H-like domain-containing protein [Favolaschia claudopus]|uniref:Ribonuclease H-like domain-containing protein n=1 Tax=Favolaschia claudopus TaxID=2862362 RepID=A0AAV9Z6G0_9AGAR